MTGQPNVVFILADQHRWDFIGGEHNGVTLTPNLDQLAAAGTRFRTAYCTAPLCCPSRAALASGRYGMNTGCFTNLHQLPPGTPSFVQQFRRAGYRTCAIGKTHMEIHADLVEDPHELRNLAGLPEHRATLHAMQEQLLLRLNENTQTQPYLSRGAYRPLSGQGRPSVEL